MLTLRPSHTLEMSMLGILRNMNSKFEVSSGLQHREFSEGFCSITAHFVSKLSGMTYPGTKHGSLICRAVHKYRVQSGNMLLLSKNTNSKQNFKSRLTQSN